MAEPLGVEDAAITKILAAIDPLISATAAQQGKPPASATYSTEEQVQMATFSPYRDPDTAIAVMVQQGLAAGKKPQDLVDEIADNVYPNLRKLIETGRPQLQERIEYGKFLAREIPKRGGWSGQESLDSSLEMAPVIEGEVLP